MFCRYTSSSSANTNAPEFIYLFLFINLFFLTDKSGALPGLIDDRGKFIHITEEEVMLILQILLLKILYYLSILYKIKNCTLDYK